MKVQVKDKQGIDEAGNKHPAPGIEDGTHSCVPKWEANKKESETNYQDNWVECSEEAIKVLNSELCLKAIGKFETRQIWVLAEQEKEGVNLDGLEKEVDTFIEKSTADTYNEAFKEIDASTRIAELSARVAELEGFLKGIVDSKIRGYEGLIYVKALATNALKNQQP